MQSKRLPNVNLQTGFLVIPVTGNGHQTRLLLRQVQFPNRETNPRPHQLRRWEEFAHRSDRVGPVFLKILGRVLYRLGDIEEFKVASVKGTFVEQRAQVAPMCSSSPELTTSHLST